MKLPTFSEEDEMSGMKRNVVLALAVAAAVAAPSAFATYGYFSHGYGMKAKGMAGAVTAATQDTFGGANNPASMVWVGSRMDVGADWFKPIRSSNRSGSAAGLDASSNSDSEDFLIPEFGYNTMLNPNMSLGVTVYGNGGMNTDYPAGAMSSATCAAFPGGTATNSNILCGTGKLGVDLMQLVIAPTLSYKVNANNSVGVSPLIGYQRFKAEGLSAFQSLSNDASNLTDRGYDSATGFGVRIGWLGKVSNAVSIGAAYSSEISMSKFDKYKGLFAEEGDFDMPSNYNVGVAVKASPAVTVSLDAQRINYSKVKSVGNPSTNTGALGTADGRGFGWKDIDVIKLGVQFQYSNATVLRAGFGKTDNPITSRDVTFNILAPGVVEEHYTLGMTTMLDKDSELTLSFMHAAENKVSGTSLFQSLGVAGAGTEEIKMHQNSLGIAWGKKW
jgi:long-chain fatty acid transport protein